MPSRSLYEDSFGAGVACRREDGSLWGGFAQHTTNMYTNSEEEHVTPMFEGCHVAFGAKRGGQCDVLLETET